MKKYLKYLKKAFFNHWNLLYVGAMTALGLLSGYPDIILPAALAFELVYLALLSTHPRFQTVVDALEVQEKKPSSDQDNYGKIHKLLNQLGPEERRQFHRLYSICLDLRRIGEEGKGHSGLDSFGISALRMDNINRLLWIYLKLLYTKKSLEVFFMTIDTEEIKINLKRAQNRLGALGPEGEDTPTEAKHRKSLMDTCHTAEMRLKNHQDAKGNHEFIQLELERLYSKISSIAEMGISRQNPETISGEIDMISSSTLHTEKTMQDLEYTMGINFENDKAPSLLGFEKRILSAVDGQ